jgi:(p)ppGpp synthase/HD superfamily hydrolase
MELVRKAHEFAKVAHEGVYRKWSGEPYVEHPARVAAMLEELGFPEKVIAAAYLHDVVEDCGISLAELAEKFSPEVAALVAEVSNPKLPKEPGNRAWRKAMAAEHLAKSSYEGASLKLADMLDNGRNVVELAPDFAVGYMPEMSKKLVAVAHGHPELVERAKKLFG